MVNSRLEESFSYNTCIRTRYHRLDESYDKKHKRFIFEIFPLRENTSDD